MIFFEKKSVFFIFSYTYLQQKQNTLFPYRVINKNSIYSF